MAYIENTKLRYVHDSDFCITRKKVADHFIYFDEEAGEITDTNVIDRFNKLRIPPAWMNVKICDDEKGHLQAVGWDSKGRKQYRYHADWTALRNLTKFHSLLQFSEILPTVREQIEVDMRLKGLPRRRVLATIVWLLEHTYMRIGNEEYAKENKHYGLTTLKNRHADVEGSEVIFEFTGKSGVKHKIDVKHPRIARIIRKMQDLPGQSLFEYVDHDRKPQRIHSEDVNEYIQVLAGADFSAKDFRTWGGTLLAALSLYQAGDFEKETEGKKKIVAAVKEVAAELGNKPATCRIYYIHPTVISSYEQKVLIPHFEAVYASEEQRQRFSKDEVALTDLLKKYS